MHSLGGADSTPNLHATWCKASLRTSLSVAIYRRQIQSWGDSDHFFERLDRALKRGGGQQIVSIYLRDTEGRYLNEPVHDITAERLFERQWALELLQRVLTQLESEAAMANNSKLFELLRPFLEGSDRSNTYREIAAKLQLSEGAFKVAVSRYRRRYRDLLRDEVARTVADPAQVDDEISDLLNALA